MDPTGALAIVMVFSIPLLAIWSTHRFNLEKLRQKNLQQSDSSTQAQMDAIKVELHQLRDTSTQYCISLENTLKRLDDTVNHMDQRMKALEAEKSQEPQRNYQSSL